MKGGRSNCFTISPERGSRPMKVPGARAWVMFMDQTRSFMSMRETGLR